MNSKDCEITEIRIGEEKLPFEKASLTMNKETIDGNPPWLNANVWTDRPTPIAEAIEQITAQWIDSGESCHQTTMDLRDACKKLMDDMERLKAEVIRTREYAIKKGIPIGECAAWCRIKEYFGTGRSDQEDFEWLREYESKLNSI